MSALEPSVWQRVADVLPPNGTWCWVWDGRPPLMIAKRDDHYACGWGNDDTWEDFYGRIAHWLAIPEPPVPTAETMMSLPPQTCPACRHEGEVDTSSHVYFAENQLALRCRVCGHVWKQEQNHE